ncbi:C4-dicarboxylate ABC transporter substrate-binding protein [Brevibacterium jeotgali]|uniref:TRAP-type C4-dicarboxylate transport system, substrate-binding protein n=1 Tax=Brevibacterium jeotgali TaxID=1262550 RepID=A0A2H1L6M3_9MICO|nr:C4-dicarboxylate ABC transporter substrate-binding protein [Brevibacterium jeotgali]TWB99068.1 TRAP-type C4-dicarboxylate transport system substrate-binding protein [Brevibacterium jeotgali]SMY12425.1 TRAP-type C4-dicarboxylate transport system, substrate-binding protein [Brevibacterium jeotgali]
MRRALLPPSPRSRAVTATAAVAALSMALSACAGSAGAGGSSDDAGDGYAYGAAQEEIDAAIADLEPVTINYQIPATSMESPQASLGTDFKEAVEERSGGKITVDLAWNQSIAAYDEVHDALADGRVDMAFTLPSYDPARFPAFNALNDLLGGDPSSPMLGEMIVNTVAADVAWKTPEILQEYEDNGLTPFVPVMASSNYYSICTEPAPGLDDWQGLQVRVGSPAANDMVDHVGGTPVSIAGVEAYEALQRGTIDCTLAVLSDVVQGGFFEVAPTLGYPTETSFPRVSGAILTGSGVEQLPLAYQQILFDAFDHYYQGSLEAGIGSKVDAITIADETGVDIEEASSDLQDEVRSFAELTRDEVAESGIIGDDIVERLDASREHWTSTVDEMGYEETGGFAEFDEWYDQDTDYTPLATALLEETMLEHRPS